MEGTVVTVAAELAGTDVTLTNEARVRVDVVGGDAVENADTSALNSTELVFPVGSVSGDQQSFSFSILDDPNVEAAQEVLSLQLTPISGASVGELGRHDVLIQDDDLATLQFGSATSVTPDESAGSYPVVIELGLPSGAALETSIVAQCVASAAGSASNGIDFDLAATTSVEFAAGSQSGATQTVNVTVLPDAFIEGDEVVLLEMVSVGDSAQVGAISSHAMTITEDDFGTAFNITVDGGAPLSGGESFDLGTATVGSGPTTGIQLELSNASGSPVELSSLDLTGDVSDFTLETAGTSATTLAALPTVTTFPAIAGASAIEDGADRVVQFDEAGLLDLSQNHKIIMDGVPIPGGGETSLELERLASPWATDARVVVDGVEHAGGAQSLTGDLSLWRGKALGLDESRAFLSFSSVGSRGWIQQDESLGGGMQLLSSTSSDSQSLESRMVWSADHEPAPMETAACLGALEAPGGLAPGGSTTSNIVSPGLTLGECRLAIETDYQLFQKFGSTSALTTYVTELVAATSEQYERDVQVRLSIAYLGVHTTSDDGWTSQDSGGNSSAVLDEFRAAWIADGWPASADLAHFLSGASLGGGVAYVNVLCSQTFGFGVSGNINTNINWAGWDFSPSSLSWDFVVFAHELGHNFGARHTHDYCPPLDNCYAGCEASGACSRGTLMSYCHACGGMSNLDLEFHPHVADAMRARVDASCLGEAALQPGTSASFRLRFDPVTSTGAKAATLSLSHDAPPTPSTFTMQLTGMAQ